MTLKQKQNVKKFTAKHKLITYNPIRPISYPDHERTILRDTAVTTNVMRGNDIIKGLFCYDAPEWLECH